MTSKKLKKSLSFSKFLNS